MKVLLLLAILINSVYADDNAAFFERPINCPLRFSKLTTLRDQMSALTSVLGNGCTQANQQALASLNSGVSNLEGITTSWKTYNSTDQAATDAQFAKNLGQILGNLNSITSSNSCFYDIRSRGAMPVLADVVLSTSQLGLLIPSAPGMMVAAGGFVAGSSLKIINELLKKKFNFNKPEERRAFLQLNCAFFENRKVMEESGIFDPESQSYRESIRDDLRKELAQMIVTQKNNEKEGKELEAKLARVITGTSKAFDAKIDPILVKLLNDLELAIGQKPADYAQKWRQVTVLSQKASPILEKLMSINLDEENSPMVDLLKENLITIIPDLVSKGKAWSANLDDYEKLYRGPIVAFVVPLAAHLNKEMETIEKEIALSEPEVARTITTVRAKIRDNKDLALGLDQRVRSLTSKLTVLNSKDGNNLFSENDEGSSDAVEILDYYRKLQKSILGPEGEDYLENTIKTASNMRTAMESQLKLYDSSKPGRERCASAEKLRFSWVQYRYKVQEAHDFVATNVDLYRSSFRVGKEKLKGSTIYVLRQIESVEAYQRHETPKDHTVGQLMGHAQAWVEGVESRIKASACF